MKVLMFLMESFIGAFGITRPKPEQQRKVALLLGGFLLLFFAGLFTLIAWMLTSGRG
jgi:hypothetical protein